MTDISRVKIHSIWCKRAVYIGSFYAAVVVICIFYFIPKIEQKKKNQNDCFNARFKSSKLICNWIHLYFSNMCVAWPQNASFLERQTIESFESKKWNERVWHSIHVYYPNHSKNQHNTKTFNVFPGVLV